MSTDNPISEEEFRSHTGEALAPGKFFTDFPGELYVIRGYSNFKASADRETLIKELPDHSVIAEYKLVKRVLIKKKFVANTTEEEI